MTFIPAVPAGGNAGWSFLQRTRETQEAAFAKSGQVKSDVAYFEANIGKVNSAGDLMKDFRLLKVALGAFGLDEAIGNKFFVRKVLEEGTLAEDAFANKLSDKRYKAMAKAFGFDIAPPLTKISDFGPKITAAYKERQFEIAVGAQDQNLRLAMGFERELTAITERASSENAMWFTIMATPPVRKVFEGALNIPVAVGTLDVDRQLSIFKAKARATFGTTDPKNFAEAVNRDELTRRFLARSDLQGGATAMTGASAALMLLQAAPSPYASLFR